MIWKRLDIRLLSIALLLVCIGVGCTNPKQHNVDAMNDISYAYHYRSLDSAFLYAQKAQKLSADYSSGYAEALNNKAFVYIKRMRYDNAKQCLDSIYALTDNQLELLVADVQQMRLCQRRARNKEFYDFRQAALLRIRRIEEEKEHLTQKVIGLNDAIAGKGKYISGKGLPSLTTHHCMADGDRSVIIQPDGGLSKCEHYAASDEFGSVYSDQRDDAKLAEWKTHAEIAMCETCPLYPSCLSPVRCPETGKCSRVKQDKDILDVKQSMLDAASKELETDNSDVEDTDEINENSKNC